jgi:hypothetical protein
VDRRTWYELSGAAEQQLLAWADMVGVNQAVQVHLLRRLRGLALFPSRAIDMMSSSSALQAPEAEKVPLLLRAVRYVLGVMTWLLIGSVLWIAGSAVARRGVRLDLGFRVPIRLCSRSTKFLVEVDWSH